MKTYIAIVCSLILSGLVIGCSDDPNYVMNRPDIHEHPSMVEIEDFHTYKAPLYWSVYENCLNQMDLDFNQRKFTIEQWKEVIDWVAKELKPHGYDMVCTDGFLPTEVAEGESFKTHYGTAAFKDIIDYAHSKGLKVGIYDIPMDYPNANRDKVPGTDYTFGSLTYNPETDVVVNPSASESFRFIVMSHPGAKEYVSGLLKHYQERITIVGKG